MRTFLNHIKNETLDEIKTWLENLWQRMIQLSEFFQYSFVLILKRKCLVGASRVRCGESGTPSTIIYTRWSSRRYELGCDAPVIMTVPKFPPCCHLVIRHTISPAEIWLTVTRRACLSQTMCFTGFEMGCCLYLWWQIKQSAEIGSVVSVHGLLPVLLSKSIYQYIFYVPLGHTGARRSKLKQGNLQKIVDFSAVEKHLMDILIAGAVT